ncbi:uncharacterized protein C3orf38 homolog isoform X2 [Pomacea canaliculata]|uniref:uncharacterized protein C3orf38 homolog isoform X2 n=1 Tax=Pomacea canaliculata TaxID=400727 RepID=UPI000D73003D|nr:uncharacterized protein C3orf38 homolog isoform X2 [Pomacea canaliculata]
MLGQRSDTYITSIRHCSIIPSNSSTMNSVESRGCKQLLCLLSGEDLVSLKDTVVGRHIAVDDDQIVKVIIRSSSSAQELLQRQRVRKDILKEYLISRSVIPLSTATKPELVQKVLDYWSSLREHEATGSNRKWTTPLKSPSTSGTIAVSSQLLQATLSNRDSQATASSRNWVTPKSPSTSETFTVSSQLLQATLSNRGSQETSSNSTWAAPTSWPTASGTFTVSSHLLQVTLPNTGFQEKQNEGSSTNQVFGESFIRWFYRLLNAENPAVPPVFERDTFGPQHFWENCSMRIISKTSNRSDQTFTGRVLVSNRLKELARDERLLFHPNVSMEGVRTMKSSYGPFILMVCGTIHHSNACLGIFHQLFGLVCDPLQDNIWKIQVTQLLVESLDDASVTPRLSIAADQDMLAVAQVLDHEVIIIYCFYFFWDLLG